MIKRKINDLKQTIWQSNGVRNMRAIPLSPSVSGAPVLRTLHGLSGIISQLYWDILFTVEALLFCLKNQLSKTDTFTVFLCSNSLISVFSLIFLSFFYSFKKIL